MSIWKTKKENPIIEKEGLYLTFSKEMGTRLLYFQKDKKLYLMCIDEYCLLDDLLNQQAEIDQLREENAKMFNFLEMVARGITLYCDTEDVIKITSDVKNFCIAKHKSEGK